jgi:hypothetical protein
MGVMFCSGIGPTAQSGVVYADSPVVMSTQKSPSNIVFTRRRAGERDIAELKILTVSPNIVMPLSP